MNPETLENLLIDRALGGLSPDVEALLADYLAANPDAGRDAAEFSETVALATALLQRPARRLELPPRVAASFSPPRSRRLLALAASFAVGAGVTLLGLRVYGPRREAPTLSGQPQPSPMPQSAARPLPPELARRVSSLPFWSKERAYLLAGAINENKPR